MTASATVVISTRNRKEELRVAIRSCLAQTVPVEIVVIDDGSTDGTSEMVRQEFPQTRVDRQQVSKGYIVQRNRGARLAGAPIIFSLDDDALFQSPRTVDQTLAEFDHRRVGAVAIPLTSRDRASVDHSHLPIDRLYVFPSYVGCSHAVRRDIFLRLGGYREFLFHQGEETEFCLRMLAAGYVTRVGHADPIHHNESLQRDDARMYKYIARNNILTAWYHVPPVYLPFRWAGLLVNLYCDSFRGRRVPWTTRGVFAGASAVIHEWNRRQPLPRQVYRLHRRLSAAFALPLDEIETLLPPIA